MNNGNSIEQQSDVLWQGQMNSEVVVGFDDDFWEAYHHLIAQAKSERGLAQAQAATPAANPKTLYLSKYGADLPTKFNYAMSDTPTTFSKTLAIAFSVLVLNIFTLFLGSLGWAMVGIIITILLVIVNFFVVKRPPP